MTNIICQKCLEKLYVWKMQFWTNFFPCTGYWEEDIRELF